MTVTDDAEAWEREVVARDVKQLLDARDAWPKRYYVVKHTWSVIHEAKTADAPGDEDHLGWHFAENSCSMNTARSLAEVAERDSDNSVCNMCAGHHGEFLGRYETAEDAEAAHPESVPLYEAKP